MKRNPNIGGMMVVVFTFVAIFAMAACWVANIVKLIHYAVDGGDITLLAILRAVGIFVAPLGAILGLF